MPSYVMLCELNGQQFMFMHPDGTPFRTKEAAAVLAESYLQESDKVGEKLKITLYELSVAPPPRIDKVAPEPGVRYDRPQRTLDRREPDAVAQPVHGPDQDRVHPFQALLLGTGQGVRPAAEGARPPAGPFREPTGAASRSAAEALGITEAELQLMVRRANAMSESYERDRRNEVTTPPALEISNEQYMDTVLDMLRRQQAAVTPADVDRAITTSGQGGGLPMLTTCGHCGRMYVTVEGCQCSQMTGAQPVAAGGLPPPHPVDQYGRPLTSVTAHRRSSLIRSQPREGLPFRGVPISDQAIDEATRRGLMLGIPPAGPSLTRKAKDWVLKQWAKIRERQRDRDWGPP